MTAPSANNGFCAKGWQVNSANNLLKLMHLPD